MARQIEAFRLRTQIEIDASKGRRDLQATEKDADKLVRRFTALGPEINKAIKGADVGRKFGKDFSSSATALITGSFDSLGQTLGSIIGTAVAPGVGTAIGSTLGSGLDMVFSKVSGTVMAAIAQGIELNKVLEQTRIEYKTFVGNEVEANKYLAELVQLSGDIGILPTTLIETSEKLYDLTGNLKLTRNLLEAAANQAEDFGGSIATFQKIADLLGLIAEKGTITEREMKSFYRVGIKVPEILAEAFGKTPAEIKKLMSEGRIRGEIAAGLIAASIEREKKGYAALQAKTSLKGREGRFGALSMIRSAEGTQNITGEISNFYGMAGDLLAGEGAKQFTQFFDQTAGKLIGLTKQGINAGVGITQGLAEGIASEDGFNAVASAVEKLGGFATTSLRKYFGIQSPSELSRLTIGVPIGEGIAQGISDGFVGNFKGKTTDEIVAALEALLQDPRVRAFFEAIKRAEGGKLNIMAGGREVTSGALHPGEVVPKSQWFRGDKGPSSAAGFYQITRTNWRALAPQLGLTNFSDPRQQLLAAMKLFGDREGGAGFKALLSGNINKARDIAALDWTSTPGSRIGGGKQLGAQKWMGYYNQALGVSDDNPLPVRLVGLIGGAFGTGGTADPRGGAATIFGEGARARPLGTSTFLNDMPARNPVIPEARKAAELFKDLAPPIAEVNAGLAPLDDQLRNWTSSMEMAALGLPPLTAAEKLVGDASIDLKETLKELEAELGLVGIAGEDLIGKLAGAIGQVAGLAPQQEVGRKRGFFSKLLGVAAPFLSFVPGVGPLLSAVAGIASSALTGDYGGALTGVAGGLQSGGVFRRSTSISPSPSTSTRPRTITARAFGGPVQRNRPYLVGELRPELFVPNQDGWIHPSVGNESAGMGAMLASLQAAIERHANVTERFESRLRTMRPDDVVAMGARGMLTAMDRDADLIRLQGRRQRLG